MQDPVLRVEHVGRALAAREHALRRPVLQGEHVVDVRPGVIAPVGADQQLGHAVPVQVGEHIAQRSPVVAQDADARLAELQVVVPTLGGVAQLRPPAGDPHPVARKHGLIRRHGVRRARLRDDLRLSPGPCRLRGLRFGRCRGFRFGRRRRLCRRALCRCGGFRGLRGGRCGGRLRLQVRPQPQAQPQRRKAAQQQDQGYQFFHLGTSRLFRFKRFA